MQLLASLMVPPPRRRVAPARPVSAGHRHRAARHRRGAGPRLRLVFALDGTWRLNGSAADRVHYLAERLEAVPAHQPVAVLERGHHAARPHGEPAGTHPRVDPDD